MGPVMSDDYYKALSDAFHRGDPRMSTEEIARLHTLAAAHGNDSLERLTAPPKLVDDTGFSDGML